MYNSKSILLLNSLTKEETRAFRKAIKSPFFTSNPNLDKLLETMLTLDKRERMEVSIKDQLYKKVFPDLPYNDDKMRTLLKNFNKVLEDFLILTDLQEQKQEREKRLLKIYAKRNLFSLFEKSRRKLLKIINSQPYRDLEYYRDIHAFDFDYFFHPMTPKHTLNDEVLVRLMDSIDKQFAMAKLRVGSEMKNREKILSKQYPIRFMDALNEAAATGFFGENILFKLYALLFDLYNTDKSLKAYEKLKAMLINKSNSFRKVDQSLLLTQLINHATWKINSGYAQYYKEALELYKLGLEKELIIKNQLIEEAVFGNIVLLGCHAKEFEWTKHFQDYYQAFLAPSIREDAIAINMGLWHFHQNDFENAYLKFTQHNFPMAYQPKVRLNIILTLYEQFQNDQSLYTLLIAQIEAFEKYLTRNKNIPKPVREADLNCIKIIKKMATGFFNREDKVHLKQTLLNRVRKKEKIVAKTWLIKKIEMIN